MKTSERLHRRLTQELGLDVDIPIRIQRGRHGKAGGTWAWSAEYRNGSGVGCIGSEDTMQECVKANKLKTYKEITPIGALVVVAEG